MTTSQQTSQQTHENMKPKTSLLKILGPIIVIILAMVGGLQWVKKDIVPPKPLTGPAGTSAGTEQKSSGQFPDFELNQFGGGKKKLSDLKAKVVFVNFWATWCEACMVEMPSIVALRKAYTGKGFEVVAINVDEKPDAVLPNVIKKLGIDFPVYTDTEGKLADLFDVHAIPLTVVMDRDRNILLTHNGEADWNSREFRAQIDGWLAK